MDCCGEYPGQYGASAGWDYGHGPYAPLPYAPYAHYYPHHDPYRYYRYDYAAHHLHHNDHVMPMDYGAYASKEARVRRVLARRDARALTPSHHLPLPPTPPLECGMSGRGPSYCEPQMWPHYQMGLGGSWSSANAVGGAWANRATCLRDQMRYPADCRPIKGPHLQNQNQVCAQDSRSTPYPAYEEPSYVGESSARHRISPEFPAAGVTPPETVRSRDRLHTEPRQSPPEEKRPPIVPLPAFQQAFGSTEIGKFAEAFSRAEVALEDASSDNFAFESFPDWDGATEPQWSSQPAPREIKCEDSY